MANGLAINYLLKGPLVPDYTTRTDARTFFNYNANDGLVRIMLITSPYS